MISFDCKKINLTVCCYVVLGAVMEAKAQLVGIHERVRSDIEGNTPSTSSVQPNSSSSSAQGGAKRMATATNPNAEDAAELLRYPSL